MTVPAAVPETVRRVRAVVFDLDGTLIDSYDAISESLNHARAGWDLPPLAADVVRRAVGRGLETLVAEHVGPDRVEAGVARFRNRYARVFRSATRALPGARDTLAALSRGGVAVAVASNKPARFTRPILEATGLEPYVGSVHGPDTVGRAKPDPAMIRRCLDDLDVPSDEAIYVGDMVLDVESARRAGVRVVLVPGGSSPIDALEATGVPVLGRLEDLVAHLGAANDRTTTRRAGDPHR